MQTYVGTKIIKARPETRDGVERLLHRSIGGKEEGAGYLVEYPDGYQSWSPKGVFDAAYRPMLGMTIGLAVEALRMGEKVARAGWNGKGMFLYFVPADEYPARTAVAKAQWGENSLVPYGAYVAMKTAQGNVVPWLASQTDLLAEDWEIVS
jgi:hypothetical protein